MKQCFRQLLQLDFGRVDRMTKVIISRRLLHNLCIESRDNVHDLNGALFMSHSTVIVYQWHRTSAYGRHEGICPAQAGRTAKKPPFCVPCVRTQEMQSLQFFIWDIAVRVYCTRENDNNLSLFGPPQNVCRILNFQLCDFFLFCLSFFAFSFI